MKGGRYNPVKQRPKMSSHVSVYYTHLMNLVDTGCKMKDYCIKDVYTEDILRNIK